MLGTSLVGDGPAADDARSWSGWARRKPVVGLVIPTGYSFNLDGTNIYMTLATLFLAQATNTHLTFVQDGDHPAGVAMLTSKGASGVTGRGLHHPGGDPGRGARHPDRRPGACWSASTGS